MVPAISVVLLSVLSCPLWGQESASQANQQRSKASLARILATQNSGKFNANNNAAKQFQHRQRILQIVDRILSLPEEELDIWKVSLTMARDAYPDLDLKTLTEQFEAIVARARETTPPDTSPDRRIRTLNTLLFRKIGIEYDKTDYMGKKLINRYAYGVAQTKKGTCANLAAFYISVAQRLGYPIHAVAAPQHLFARYVDPELVMQNIDPVSQGGWDPDEEYVRKTEIPQRALDNGVYLRTMTNKELAAELIADHGAYYYGQVLKDYSTAAAILERALQHSPRASEFWNLLGQIDQRWSQREFDPDIREARYMRGVFFKNRSGELGIGQPLTDEYWKRPPPKKDTRGPGV